MEATQIYPSAAVLLAQTDSTQGQDMKPLVSVIIPIYNAEAYLKETLDSVLASDYEALEVVMVDDGSEDQSLAIAQEYAQKDNRCTVIHQDNAGVSVARNRAIHASHGKYILPVDSDNLIEPTFISEAVAILKQQMDIKGVGSKADFIGKKRGEWKLPEYHPQLLARKNIIDACAMYRRSDYDLTDGYMEHLQIREDWDFWLSMLEKGGRFYRIPKILFHYRVREDSKRIRDRKQKKELIRIINQRHSAFEQRWLGGPLHYHRSWSRFINFFRSVKQIGAFADWDKGEVLHEGRNTIRIYKQSVIKHFGTPSLWQRLWYSWFGKSKARRSYENASLLGSLTPTPIAYREIYEFGILRANAYVCQLSECDGTFNDLIGHPDYPQRAEILKAIGRFTAQMHRLGAWHKDYSGGNILFDSQTLKIEVIDLNRMRWRLPKQPLMQFERLNIDRDALRIMVTAYAEERGIDVETAVSFVIAHRWRKHIKQGITNL